MLNSYYLSKYIFVSELRGMEPIWNGEKSLIFFCS